jgi:hypothetical protein
MIIPLLYDGHSQVFASSPSFFRHEILEPTMYSAPILLTINQIVLGHEHENGRHFKTRREMLKF